MTRLLPLMWLNKLCRAIDRPAIIAVSRLLTILLTLGTAPLVARTLGPEGRGVYAAALAALTLSPIIFGLGIPIAIRRLTTNGRIDNHVRTLYLLAPVLCIPAALVAYPIVQFLIVHLTAVEQLSFALAMAASALYVITLSAQSIFIARAKYLNVAALQAIQIHVVSVLTIVFFLTNSLSLNTLLNFYSIATLITSCLSVALLKIPLRGPRSNPKMLIRDGSRYAVSQVAEASAFSLYQLLAITALGAYPAGYLAIGMTIASLPVAVAHTVGAVAFREVANAGDHSVREVVASFLRVSTFLGIGTAALLAVITPVAVPLIFGAEFEAGVPLMLGVLIGCPALIVNYVGMQMLAAVGKGFRMAAAQLFGIALGIILLYGLGFANLQSLGGVAVAIGWTSTSVLIASSLPLRVGLLFPRKDDYRSTWEICIRGKLPISNPTHRNIGTTLSSRTYLISPPRRDFRASRAEGVFTRSPALANSDLVRSEKSPLVVSVIYLFVLLIFSGALVVKAAPVGFTLTVTMVILIFALTTTNRTAVPASGVVSLLGLLIWVLTATIGLDLSSATQRYTVIFPLACVTGYLLFWTGQIKCFVKAYITTALLMSALAIAERLAGRSLIGDEDRFAFFSRLREFRSAVAAEHPLILGIYLAVAIIAFAFVDISTTRRIAVCTVLCLGIVSTDGRIPLLLGIVSSIAICFFRDVTLNFVKKRRKFLLFASAVAWLTIGWLSVFQWTNSAYGSTAADSSAAYRPAIYSLIPDIVSRQYAGVGFSDIPRGIWLIRGRSITFDLANTVDSEVVLLAVRFGYFGLFAFAAVWLTFIICCRFNPVIGAMGIGVLVAGFSTAITAWNTLGSFAFVLLGVAIAQLMDRSWHYELQPESLAQSASDDIARKNAYRRARS
ncbi:hypothetical protein CH298_07235 [Rhodococcoides fascians]|nr:hypothetical protein CH303_07215 [Rhodococcus fascians]OZF20644.1 hypothetical protein CH298_07235 [Rhodococcus fascians]OZF23645.1 hypothetical protein CH297_07225 [Rhodococcus fascians]OZF69762.1 hypothetical protein CH308_07030 [Rhodococcus fascians]OZF72092.1 hypothetical protein CH307_07035 [Rhodococcus fascians]